VVSLIATFAAVILAWLLRRTLTRQIGDAIAQLQSSTAELQAAAAQQATGTKQQATATSEVSTTLKELVATSRQIGESARHVVKLAEEARSATKLGDQTGSRAQEAVAMTKRQVDMVVNHMLDLGKKSQQIGNVLEIINELAEQTNILSINATIEAAGAGETGKRFGSVADEIRKLADRTANSTKEIRALIEEIRAGVNTTVMATETGSKAADAGHRQIADVTSALGRITETVSPTSQAAREIELSTEQQTTAVEQVNVAVASVAQAAKESEIATTQTVQAASQLAVLAKNLGKLIHARAE
jgi:methyl-accepting chemotaxis protein